MNIFEMMNRLQFLTAELEHATSLEEIKKLNDEIFQVRYQIASLVEKVHKN